MNAVITDRTWIYCTKCYTTYFGEKPPIGENEDRANPGQWIVHTNEIKRLREEGVDVHWCPCCKHYVEMKGKEVHTR